MQTMTPPHGQARRTDRPHGNTSHLQALADHIEGLDSSLFNMNSWGQQKPGPGPTLEYDPNTPRLRCHLDHPTVRRPPQDPGNPRHAPERRRHIRLRQGYAGTHGDPGHAAVPEPSLAGPEAAGLPPDATQAIRNLTATGRIQYPHRRPIIQRLARPRAFLTAGNRTFGLNTPNQENPAEPTDRTPGRETPAPRGGRNGELTLARRQAPRGRPFSRSRGPPPGRNNEPHNQPRRHRHGAGRDPERRTPETEGGTRMATEIHIYADTGLTQQDYQCFFSNHLGTCWQDLSYRCPEIQQGTKQPCSHYQHVRKLPEILVGETPWPHTSFDRPEGFPDPMGDLAEIFEKDGNLPVTITAELTDSVEQALRNPAAWGQALPQTFEPGERTQEIRDFLENHMGRPAFLSYY